MVRDDHNKAWLDRRGLAAVVGRHIQSAIIEGEFQPQVFFPLHNLFGFPLSVILNQPGFRPKPIFHLSFLALFEPLLETGLHLSKVFSGFHELVEQLLPRLLRELKVNNCAHPKKG